MYNNTILPNHIANSIKDHNNRLDVVEAIIDAIGIVDATELIAEICSAKADHIRESYDGPTDETAITWDQNAENFLMLAEELSK